MHMAFDVYSHTILNGRIINLHDHLFTLWGGHQVDKTGIIYILVNFIFLIVFVIWKTQALPKNNSYHAAVIT